jgi:hypothetical protein
LLFVLACDGNEITAPVVGIPKLLPKSSIVAVHPTNIGDCLASVGDVGINVSSSSSNFV